MTTGSRFSLLADDVSTDEDLLITGVSPGRDNYSSQCSRENPYNSKNDNNGQGNYSPQTKSQYSHGNPHSSKNDKKVLLLGNSHLLPIIEDNLIKNHVVEKQICYTSEEGIDFLKNF